MNKVFFAKNSFSSERSEHSEEILKDCFLPSAQTTILRCNAQRIQKIEFFRGVSFEFRDLFKKWVHTAF